MVEIVSTKKIDLVGTEIADYVRPVPAMLAALNGYLWSSYADEADVLYINFKKPSIATDSELAEDDVIFRYQDE